MHHDGDTVVLSQPTHYAAVHSGRRDRLDEKEFDVRARVPTEHYRRQIVAFAEAVRDFFAKSEPRQMENWEREFDDRFWGEFEQRLERANTYMVNGTGVVPAVET